jgi:glutamine synthetase adenylyltransferase
LQDIYRAYRLRLHHLTLAEEKLLVPDEEFVAERKDVRETWRALFGESAA